MELPRLLGVMVVCWVGVAAADPASSGLTWILSQQAADGSFGGTTGEQKVLATVEALETLRAAGQGQTPAAHAAELFLAIAPRTQDAEVELRRELALAPTGQALSLRVRTSHATGFEHKDALHLALTLRNDIAAGRAGDAESFQRMLDLEARQLASGCWRWADNDDSVELTSDAVRTLRALLDVPTEGRASNGHLDAALDEGARCLGNASGGSLSATAMRLEALLAAPGTHTTQIADARAVLAAAQASDGSIGGTVRTTAIAVRGLLPGKPDWRIVPDDFNRPVLAFDDANPLAGIDAVARLNIDNRSGTAAPATTVRILLRPLDGGAEQVGAEAPLGALAAGASAALAVHVPSAALQGKYSVRAVVDPDHVVAEISEANNEARQLLNVRAEADLSVAGSSIRFTPVAAGQTRVEVTVRNLGIPLDRPVSVGVWKGNPSTGGVRIGGATLAAGLPTNGTGTVSVMWSSSSANGPTVVTAVVDELDVLPEADETNNAAFRFYFPGSDQPVDLAVADADVAFTPGQLHVGDLVTFTAVVKNLSSFDASRVPVAMTDTGGVIVGQTELPFVPAHGSAVASFRFAMTNTSVSGRIQVDPAQQLNDSDRSNNTAAGPMARASATPDVDFNVLSAVDRSSTRTVEVLVRNNGTKPVATTVELFDITHGISLGSQPIVLPTGYATSFSESLSFSIPADTSPAVLRACADPSNVVAEPNENDNCAEVALSGFERVDLITRSKDLRFSPVGAAVGENVHVTATVHNQGGFAGRSRPAKGVVEFWHSVPGSKAGKFLGTVPFAVNASSDVTVDFDWVRADGPVELCVRVAQVQPADQVALNNIACRNLFLEQVVDLFPATMFQSGENLRVARLTGRPAPEILVAYEDTLPSGPLTGETGLMVLQRSAGGTYAPLWSVPMPADTRPTDIVVADLDGDGAAEVVLFTAFQDHGGTLPSTSGVTAYRADGSVKWTTSFVPKMARPGLSQRGNHFGEATGGQLSVGDVNGDGVADIVTVEETVRVFSGDDGHLVWSAPNPAVFFSSPPTDCRATVLDVDGGGTHEVFSSCGAMFLLSSTGSLVWTNPSNCSFHHQVIDLDLDGSPEGVVACEGNLVALDLRNGAQKARLSAAWIWGNATVPFGAVLQDGLPYAVASDNSGSTTIFGFRPSMDVLWQQSVARPDNGDVYAGLLVDLLGLGRPQFVASSPTRPLLLQDGRDGRLLLEVPLSQFGAIAGSNFTYGWLAPVVADLGTGHASVLVTRSGARGEIGSGGPPHDGAGEFLIMSSPHWTKQPALWATRVMRHGQIDETTLKVSNDYRWWTSHNTWQQQYDVAPAKLLPDLTVALAASPAPGTAGEATTLTATVKNLGGAPATTAVVSFFDGDPSNGGKAIGTAPVGGSVAGRGGTSTATLSWTAFPEGEHMLFAVAGGVEESGTENNSARLRYFVQPGAQLCDAAVNGSTLAASPAQPSAGQAVQLSATVTNLGPIACAAHVLTVRDGAGGEVLGTVSVPSLAQGAQATVAVSFRAIPGSHLLRVIADEAQTLQDGDLANNVATLALDVPPAIQPDYTATSIVLTPGPARAGELVTARVTVKNQGVAVTAQTRLEVSVDAQTVGSVTVDALGASESKTYTVKLVAPSAATAVVARVDADGALTEFDETNNVRSAPLAIESSGLVLTGSATPSSALPDTSVRFTVLAQLSSPSAKEVWFDATLLGAGGVSVATVASGVREVIVSGSSSRSFTLDTGRLAPDT
ncbi:MAG TPA: CARDB domain-containing protein, partial [Kofleriaceae bacterium]